MQKRIIDITPEAQEVKTKKRVAAYARVSCDKDTMLHSLAAQIDFYRNYIIENAEWEFAGIYADEAKTGTKDDREQFQRLLSDCRVGKIDMVITKSISRFARNTVTLLNAVRELKELGINVFFEDQNMNSISTDGEVMLTLMASIAQAESLSCSDNCKWRIRKGFKSGRASTCTMLGYRLVHGEITLIPEEAEVVKEIYNLYLSGFGAQAISNTLNERRAITAKHQIWHPSTIRKILCNEKYMGNLRLQQTYVKDHISKKKVRNDGALPQYYVEDDHDAIISKEMFAAVQSEIEHRANTHTHKNGSHSVFTGVIRCGICGKNYRRKTTPYNIVWCCSTFNTKGKGYCASKVIPEETIKRMAAIALSLDSFDEQEFSSRVERIEARSENLLRFIFFDGTTAEYSWEDRSRSESWTPEMREAARQKIVDRR